MDPMTMMALASTAASVYGSLKGAGDVENVNPSSIGNVSARNNDFFTDKDYLEGQKLLTDTGKGLLKGKPNDYYKPIGEIGSTQFNDLLRMVNRDITTGVNENLAKRGVTRGGIGAAAIGRATGDASTKLRYDDMLRAIKGREFLLGTGLDTIQSTRNAGLTYGGQKNEYNLNKEKLALMREKIAAEQDASNAGMLGNLFGSVGGFAGNLLGYSAANKAGSSSGGNFLSDISDSGFSSIDNPDYNLGSNDISFGGKSYNSLNFDDYTLN